MSMMGKMVLGDGSLFCLIDGKNYDVQRDHPKYLALKTAFKDNDHTTFLNLYNQQAGLSSYLNSKEGLFELDTVNKQIKYKGKVLDNTITRAIIRMYNDGHDIEFMLKFLHNLYQNPSMSSIEQLYDFLQACGLYITEDGCFLAYKAVRSDYKDKHTGTIDNRVGAKIPRMDRNEVSDDRNKACHCGYHAGALEYAGPNGQFYSHGDHIMIVKINPADVVSVPYDAHCRKLRCCYYEVVAEYTQKLNNTVYKTNADEIKSNKKNTIVNNKLSPDDMLINRLYTFEYNNEDRHGILVNVDDFYILMYMAHNDKSPGKFRKFKKGYIHNIKVPSNSSTPTDEVFSQVDESQIW